ncbi:transmembrane protein 200C [Scophthalmus maximus]|uniref:transmembrane protein 200C n=1 Tax=Scophthalmus maximus TaxID=52904 RepID=UPI0015E0DDF2|nr:transmembrane protein 200C [Scophthalmus maximus]
MIATGGLLRINARRQDSLRHKPHTHKKKKKKRRSEVVVVKGKLKLCSLSGLVAALGVLVLLVGSVMAALGYWPRDGLFVRAQPQEGTVMASVSSTPAPADAQGGERGEELQRDRGGARGEELQRDRGGGDDSWNQTETVNGTRELQQGFLEGFLDRYLSSDRLKVFGPLIMGIGIFLFICANAVLHENRDKKTKVINLRDIYSTVIDLHSLRRPNTSCSTCLSSTNPLNGLVNYVQSKSLECKPSTCPTSLRSRGDGGGREQVFSIYQERPDVPDIPVVPDLPPSHRLSLPPSFSPPPSSSHPQHPAPPRRHSSRARTGWGRGEGRGGEAGDACPPPPLCSSTPPPPRPSCSSSSLQREAPGGSQALLLHSSSSLTPSHLSLSSLSHLLYSSSALSPPGRRRSLPSGSVVIGYSKLANREDESFESTEMTSSHRVTSQRKYSNREKLRMISQVHSGPTHDEEETGRPIRS